MNKFPALRRFVKGANLLSVRRSASVAIPFLAPLRCGLSNWIKSKGVRSRPYPYQARGSLAASLQPALGKTPSVTHSVANKTGRSPYSGESALGWIVRHSPKRSPTRCSFTNHSSDLARTPPQHQRGSGCQQPQRRRLWRYHRGDKLITRSRKRYIIGVDKGGSDRLGRIIKGIARQLARRISCLKREAAQIGAGCQIICGRVRRPLDSVTVAAPIIGNE